jgi:hypothetical protein
MHARPKPILTALTASLLLGLAATSATAGRLRTSTNRFRVVWAALNIKNFENELEIRCPLTLEGSFHSATIRKTRAALIGAVTLARINGSEPPCTGGRATILQESLPWHLTFESFRGTLPRIERVILLLRRYEFRVELTVFGFRVGCLYLDQNRPEENLASELTVNETTGQVTALIPLSGRYAGFRIGSELCSRRLFFSGTGAVFAGNSSTTRITITLI